MAGEHQSVSNPVRTSAKLPKNACTYSELPKKLRFRWDVAPASTSSVATFRSLLRNAFHNGVRPFLSGLSTPAGTHALASCAAFRQSFDPKHCLPSLSGMDKQKSGLVSIGVGDAHSDPPFLNYMCGHCGGSGESIGGAS